jgi:hypothetical protein
LLLSPNYEGSETLWYHLIGLGIEEKRKIYLVHSWNPDQVFNYLRKDTPFFLYQERMLSPTKLSVYGLDPMRVPALQKKGLIVIKINNEVFQIK